jgi:transcriptional regulator with XRE-family HTH domain
MFQVSRLREWRERRMLSTRELAELAGVGEATIWRLEGGKTARPATIRALAKALGVEPYELVGDRDKGSLIAAA